MQLIPRRKRKPVHRFAAHQVAIPVAASTVKAMSAKLDDWQAKVLNYADIIPELMTGYLFVHNTLDLVTFEIQKFDRHANEWVTDESPEIQGIERRVNLAFKAGRAAALGHLVEEAYVLVRRTTGYGFEFETLAPTEIQSKGTKVQTRVPKDGESLEWRDVPEDTTVIRIYTPDPKDRTKASGPHKPLLGLLETMALELSRDQADAVSVLAGNGILYIPTEVLPDEVDSLDAADTPGSRKAFENALEEGMLATITDRQRGEAVVPLLLYGQGEYGEQIRHILPKRSETASEATERMQGYINRYAGSIDLPRQVILGIGDANHWGDWKVDENTWAYHLRPRGQRIADALYDGLVKGILENLGKDSAEYRMAPDATAAIATTDISRNAVEAYKLGAITAEAFVEALGFDPSDLRVDADELLLQIIAGAGLDDDQVEAARQALPDRRAAAVRPETVLKHASKIANAQQAKLEALFRSVLSKVADDAARDGARVKAATERTAKSDLPFEGYDPATYFARYADQLASATRDELFAYLKRIATLTGLDYRTLRSVWTTQFDHRAEHVGEQARIAALTIAQRSLKSGKPMRVNDNVLRTLSSTANGGSNQGNGAAGNTNRPTHAGEDQVMRDALTQRVGSYATQYTWHTGHPDRPYPPHQALDGKTWFSWQEFDALDVSDKDAWLGGSVYYPGDHDGCQCEYAVEFVAVPAPQEDA